MFICVQDLTRCLLKEESHLHNLSADTRDWTMAVQRHSFPIVAWYGMLYATCSSDNNMEVLSTCASCNSVAIYYIISHTNFELEMHTKLG